MLILRQAQDDPERRRTAQGPELACGEPVETVEGQAIFTSSRASRSSREKMTVTLIALGFPWCPSCLRGEELVELTPPIPQTVRRRIAGRGRRTAPHQLGPVLCCKMAAFGDAALHQPGSSIRPALRSVLHGLSNGRSLGEGRRWPASRVGLASAPPSPRLRRGSFLSAPERKLVPGAAVEPATNPAEAAGLLYPPSSPRSAIVTAVAVLPKFPQSARVKLPSAPL